MARISDARPPAEVTTGMKGPGRAGSKYDFVKVRVWLGEDQAHWYTLSRFLISRTLTVTQIPADKAVKIALAVKKELVDHDRLDISQAELESVLCMALDAYGFGSWHLPRYRTVSTFFHQRHPLIILLCGTMCTGKSTIAQQLASRLNLPNVLQTDLLMELLRGDEASLTSTSTWETEGESDMVAAFQAQSRYVRRGLSGDLSKCMREGKAIIVEGYHLDPGLYLNEFGSAAALVDRQTGKLLPMVRRGEKASDRGARERGGEGASMAAALPPDSRPPVMGPEPRAAVTPAATPLLFVPVVLWMHEDDHATLLSCRHDAVADRPSQQRRARGVQQYLLRSGARGVPLMQVRPGSFQEVVDTLHSHVLAAIELAAGQ